jgi:hypothetical protein
MIEKIRKALSAYDLIDAEEIAQAVEKELDTTPHNDNETIQMLFTPRARLLFNQVAQKLHEEKSDLSEIKTVFYKIQELSKNVPNGIMFLSLAEATTSVLVGMLEQADRLQKETEA